MAQPTSPRDPLREGEVTLQVVNYDPAQHAREATILSRDWLEGSARAEVIYLDSRGRARLPVRSSVAQQYRIVYGGQVTAWLQPPGRAVALKWEQTGREAGLTAPDDPLVAQSMEVMAYLEGPSTYAGLPTMTAATGLTEFMRAYARREADLRKQLGSLITGSGPVGQEVMAWAEQFVDYRMKREVQLFPIVVETEAGPARDSLLALARFPDTPLRLEETGVYADSYLDYVYFQTLGYGAQSKSHVASLPKEERSYAGFVWRDSTIRAIDHPFTRDYLLARNFNQFLNAPNRDPRIESAAEAFVGGTPFPLLREPIARQLLVLAQPSAPGEFERNFLELPEGVDNPVPEILRRHAGKVIVLDFWATWCGPCRHEFTYLYPQLIGDYGDDGVAFVFLSVDDQEKIWRDYVSRLPFDGDHLLLNHAQRAIMTKEFGISGFPHRAVFDREGKLVKRSVSMASGELEKVIQGLVGK